MCITAPPLLKNEICQKCVLFETTPIKGSHAIAVSVWKAPIQRLYSESGENAGCLNYAFTERRSAFLSAAVGTRHR